MAVIGEVCCGLGFYCYTLTQKDSIVHVAFASLGSKLQEV